MLTLVVLPETLAICRLEHAASVPMWATGNFISITRTRDELSLTGVLASIAAPLAEAQINIFAISTFDTDYVLVKGDRLAEAIAVLRSAGHRMTSDE